MDSDLPVRRLLHIHKDPNLGDRLRGQLGSLNRPRYSIAHYTHLIDGMTYLKVNPVDLVLVGPRPTESCLHEAIANLKTNFPDIPLVGLMADEDPAQRETLLATGANECLSVGDINGPVWNRTFEFCLRETAISRELATVNARLDWLVHRDSLTGLLNRKGMERSIMGELARCRAAGCELTILLIDLDDFSRVNATLGHGVGDMVLMGAAKRIADSVRPHDKVGRCGTDRFLVMMPGADMEDGAVVAENIRLAITREVITAGDHTLTTTASLGLTTISPTSLCFDEVLAKAHFVLQRGKLKGKNQVCRAASVQDLGKVKPMDSGPEMVRALLRGHVLEVASQPIVNLVDGRIVSREMLVRGPEGPLRSPDNLFRFCQEKNILTAVDLRCLKLCSATASILIGQVNYHVNIMPATLLDTPVEELIRVLAAEPDRISCCLEISEQQLLGDPSPLVPRVRVLQEAGIRIAIDDVGFGNSCLEGLIMLHPQVVKIDKRLVQGLAADQELQRILNRLLKVADVLGAEVVAEGIEIGDDYHMLLDMGVRYGQGYLFGKPVLSKMEAAAPAIPRSKHPSAVVPPEPMLDGA